MKQLSVLIVGCLALPVCGCTVRDHLPSLRDGTFYNGIEGTAVTTATVVLQGGY